MRFLGNFKAKIDAKGRIFLPAAFRKVLQTHSESNLILRKDIYQKCLVLYPESIWNEMSDTLRNKLDRWDPIHQSLFRQFVANVETVTLDTNGRLLISKRFSNIVNIQQEVSFIGIDNIIEIWGVEELNKSMMDVEEFSATFESTMKKNNSENNNTL